tara:strand:- start:350 stop:460 length:111 start_codon:yes stop_codon:yes gene_type:complete
VSLKLRRNGSEEPLTLSHEDVVIKFVNLNLEPMRSC